MRPWSCASVKAISDMTTGTLRFTTAGSVDDGKSTLIGRLLLDAKGLLEDQLAAVARSTARAGGEGLDLSLFTDGLTLEREQGITIDRSEEHTSELQSPVHLVC